MMVLFGSVPGLKKLFGVLLVNPAYALPFFLSYYLKMITTGNDQVFGIEGTKGVIKRYIVENNLSNLEKVLRISTNYLIAGIGIKQQISNQSISALAKTLILLKGKGLITKVEHLKTPYLTKDVIESLEMVCYDPNTREKINFDYSVIEEYLERSHLPALQTSVNRGLTCVPSELVPKDFVGKVVPQPHRS